MNQLFKIYLINTIYKFKYGIKGFPYNTTSSVTIKGNKLQARYYVPGNSNFEGTAIYVARGTSLTPELFLIDSNAIDSCQFGVYISKINKVKISNNNIFLRKPASGTIYNHYGLYMLETSNDTIKVNTIKTNNATFTNLSTTDRGKYTGAFLQVFTSSSITDNDISNFARHIELNSTSTNNRISCNYFTRGLTASDATPTNTFKLTSANLTNSNFGFTNKAADNYWSGFPATDISWAHRFVGNVVVQANYYHRGENNSTNYYNPLPSAQFLISPNINIDTNSSCNAGITGINTLIILNSGNENLGSENFDLAKNGDEDSTETNNLENYEPVYDSTNVVTDFFVDMANYNMALAYAAEGLLDSTMIEQNYEGTLIGDLINLDLAMNEGDSIAAQLIISNLLQGDEMLDNIITVTEIQLEGNLLNHSDSLTLEALAMLKVSEGGPAVVSARNILDRYVEEDESIDSQNKSKKNRIDNTFWASIYPNPSNGELVVKTNQENLLSIEITDVMGKLVYQKNNIENNKILHLSKLHSGLYSIKLQDENNKIKLFKWVVLK